MRLNRAPYHLLLFTGLLLVVFSFFISSETTVDIHIYDTMFVIAPGHIYLLLSFIVLFLWLLYLPIRNVLYRRSLTWIHVLVTVLTVSLFIFFLHYETGMEYPHSSIPGQGNRRFLEGYNFRVRTLTFLFFGLILAQAVFVINLVIGLFMKINKTRGMGSPK